MNMTRRTAYFLIITILAVTACGRNAARQARPMVAEPARETPSPETAAVDEGRPEIVRRSVAYDYYGFGEIGTEVRKYREDKLRFPPIPGLVHKTAYAFCKRDTCHALYAVLALRCPKEGPLLGWMEGRVRQYVADWPASYACKDYDTAGVPGPGRRPRSARDICNHYMGWLEGSLRRRECNPEDGTSRPNVEYGLLLSDCWRKGNLCTFYEGYWSNENNMPHEAFRTVDATTGKELGLDDLVVPEGHARLAALMMPRIVNSHGDRLVDGWSSYKGHEAEVLKGHSGCGLMEEGLIIYFYPYNLGSGADGEHEAVIPYGELAGLLKPEIRLSLGID